VSPVQRTPSSTIRKHTSRVPVPENTSPSGSSPAKRKVQADYVVNAVGSNPVEIGRLHRKNSISYLRYTHDVEAAGETRLMLLVLLRVS